MRGHELVGMRLFSKVKVRRDRVFEEMNNKIAREHQKGRALSAQRQALRNDLDDCCGQHESCAQSHEIFEVRPLPMLLNDDGPAKDVRGSRGKAQQKAENDGVHWEWE